jgi:hypothetical protein
LIDENTLNCPYRYCFNPELQEFIDICDYAVGLSRMFDGKIFPSESNFNNKSYFAAYNGISYSLYSFDGTTWTTISSLGNSYNFIGQIGNISYLGYYNGSSYVYSTFNGTSFASWSPSGLPLNTNPYNFNIMGVINNKLYTAINTSGTPIMYSFDGTSFTNLSSITNPGNYYGGWNCYMCNSFFIGGNLK